MALHNLKIVVVDGGRSGNYKSRNKSSKNVDNSDVKDTPLYKMLHLKENIKNKVKSGISPSASFAMNIGLGMAKQVAKQSANFYITDIGRKNGDSNYQDMINRKVEIAGEVVGFGASALGGAATGSMFGPIGAVIGAVMGVAGAAISLGFKYAERERQYQHETFKRETSQADLLARANYSSWTGRLR